MSDAFVLTQIANLQALVTAHMASSLEAANAGIQSYTVDSGQDRNTAVRYSVAEVQRTVARIMDQIEMFEARLSGSNIVRVEPGF